MLAMMMAAVEEVQQRTREESSRDQAKQVLSMLRVEQIACDQRG
jgi:hypothetical protein